MQQTMDLLVVSYHMARHVTHNMGHEHHVLQNAADSSPHLLNRRYTKVLW